MVVVVVVGIVALAKPILALVPPPAVKTVVIGLFPLKNEVTAAPGLTLIPVYHMFKFPPFSTTDGKATPKLSQSPFAPLLRTAVESGVAIALLLASVA